MAKVRLGMHLLTKAGDQFFGNESTARQSQVDIMRQMHITDLKLLTDGDSQLKAAKWLVLQGFRVIVRFWKQPPTWDIPPTDLMQQFAGVGVQAVESYVNEPEVELGRPPTPDVITQLAQMYLRFADQCAHAGLTPITPSMQGDRVYSWFEPFVARIVVLGRKDALEGSIIGVHARPANNLPDAAPPGFCVRSYELFDDVVVKYIGRSLRQYSTEWGYEPGDSDNKTLPPINLARHMVYNVRIAQMDYRPCLDAVFYWTWLNDWGQSGWWRGDVVGSLPVVKAFIDMAHPVEPPFPPPPPPEPPIPQSVAEALLKAVDGAMEMHPFGVKEALRRGFVPFGDEAHVFSLEHGKWYGQPARRPDGTLCVLAFKAGEYAPGTAIELEYKLP